ncbi:hypothetical protein ACJMK2_032730 [Sinanodonta woodiana]|uniref:Uncharacterized protein n=1 Tax=Sinanodonta woodiana TaxID=1069815 RepID=A0ABD3X4I7_SINWO
METSKDKRTFDEKFIICSICSRRFMRPKILPCLHTFCENCLSQHIIKHADEDQIGHRRSFPCPQCKTSTSIIKPELPLDKWTELLPDNKMMMALLESISLQVDDKVCGPCNEGGQTVVATFWCRDCVEALCDDCLKYHRLLKVSKKHKIEELLNIRSNPKRILSVPQPCPDHIGKDIELFCGDHNQLCCVMCVATEHRRCERVASIEKLAKEIEEKLINDELIKKLDIYNNHLEAVKRNREANIELLKNQKTEILENFTNYKDNINILLDKLETTITDEFTALHVKEHGKLKDDIDTCNNLQNAIENTKNVLKITNRHCSNAQLFITVQQVINKAETYEKTLMKAQDDLFEQVEYSFEIDSSFEALLQALVVADSMGKVHSHHRRPSIPSSPGSKPLCERKAEKFFEFNAKTPSDTRNCCLSAAAFLADKRILVTDQNNQKIKLFTNNGNLICEHSFTTWPRDFAEIGENRIAVTLPKERKIEIFYAGKKLKRHDTFKMPEECWGIAYAKNKIIVSCIRPDRGCLKFLNIAGRTLDVAEEDSYGNRLFAKTNYVVTDTSGEVIYVTDRSKDVLMALVAKRGPKQTEDQTPGMKPRQRSSTALGGGIGDANRSYAGPQNKNDYGGREKRPVSESAITDLKLNEFARPGQRKSEPGKMLKESDSQDSLRLTPIKENRNASMTESIKTEDIDALKTSFDMEMDSVNSEEMEGTDFEVQFTYSAESLRSAGALAVDHEGNIYITGYRSANVHQLQKDGSLNKVLVEYLTQPLAIGFEMYGDRFLLTETASSRQNFVQMYRMV